LFLARSRYMCLSIVVHEALVVSSEIKIEMWNVSAATRHEACFVANPPDYHSVFPSTQPPCPL
jgi:hypothetical protein